MDQAKEDGFHSALAAQGRHHSKYGYEYLVILFGHASAIFQSLVNNILCDMLNVFVFVYLDDILIFTLTGEEYVDHPCQVLQWLFQNKLFVKAEKCVCVFQQTTV